MSERPVSDANASPKVDKSKRQLKRRDHASHPRQKIRTKGDQALLTISELAEELGVGSHILRYWENHFPALRPLQRAGNRRYYRPDDVALAHQINHLLKKEGYTVRGAVKFLSSETQKRTPIPVSIVTPSHQTLMPEKWVEELRYISEMLSSALMVE